MEIVFAVPALPAGDERGHHDPITFLDLLYLRPDFLDYPHELMADPVAGLHRRDVAVDEMQVGAAGGRHGDAEDGVVGVDDLGILHRCDAQVVDAVPNESAHARSPG